MPPDDRANRVDPPSVTSSGEAYLDYTFEVSSPDRYLSENLF